MPTIYDVAQLAEVSHTAVSAVMNDRPIRMREATKQRILDAAKTLGYKANRAAQQLSTGRFNSIGLCFAQTGTYIFESPTTNQLVAGVVHSASESGLCLLLAPTRQVVAFEETIARLPSQGVDGAIVIGPIRLPGENVCVNSHCDIPLVCIDPNPGIACASTVDTDGFGAMRMGVEKLISMGHKKMAYIGPTPEYQCLVDRMRGFYQAVQDAGLPLADQVTGVVPLEDVPTQVRRLVAMTNGPTAWVSAEELTTAAVLDEVARLGLRIPDDVSILSYDDVPQHSLCGSVHIIRNDFFAMGEAAADLLWKLISGACSGPVSLRLPAELIMRTP